MELIFCSQIERYPDFEITSKGDVQRISDGYKLSQHIDKSGYKCIKLRKTTYVIHRLVAKEFVSNPNKFTFINHKDDNRLNNDCMNLEWVRNNVMRSAKHCYEDTEEWRIIKGYSGYEVSKTGKIRNEVSKRELSAIKIKDGSLHVNIISDENKHKTPSIHKLVAIAFIDNPKNRYYVRHKDNNPLNNNVENLEWYGSDFKKKVEDEEDNEDIEIDDDEYKTLEGTHYTVTRKGEIEHWFGSLAERKVNGYMNVNIYNKGKTKVMSVHRLVAKSFIPNPKNKPNVNHKDGKKTNNHVENLEWTTQKQNIKHALETGLIKPHKRAVIKYSKDDKFIERFESVDDAARSVKLTRHAIIRACRGIIKVCGGFTWKYEKENEKVDISNTVPIKDFPNYLVSPEGWVYSKLMRKKLVNMPNESGYEYLTICDKRQKKNMYVHDIVAKAFIPNPDPENKTQVNHKDENKRNNNVTNLEWMTPSENVLYSIKRNLCK